MRTRLRRVRILRARGRTGARIWDSAGGIRRWGVLDKDRDWDRDNRVGRDREGTAPMHTRTARRRVCLSGLRLLRLLVSLPFPSSRTPKRAAAPRNRRCRVISVGSARSRVGGRRGRCRGRRGGRATNARAAKSSVGTPPCRIAGSIVGSRAPQGRGCLRLTCLT
ncbi:hypothetical protein B0H13DRAFT_1980443 [Mycena leptocephala]|nr:hypothetical protein B0H13DRAFT_1980443 [Mycena leptocephala]